jgi:hypothetical protein
VVVLLHWRVAVFGVAAVSVAAAVAMTAAVVMTAGAADGALKTSTTATGAWICNASVGGRRISKQCICLLTLSEPCKRHTLTHPVH